MKDNHLAKKKQQSKSPKKNLKEQLSTKDIEELMGMNRDTYTRRNGAVRRK
jgi:hypothetical protein